MRKTPDEMLQKVKEGLATKHWQYSLKPHGWFFPSDVYPHSATFNYKCRKLYSLGMLERRGDSNDRWGYQYRVPGSESSVRLQE